MNPNPRFPSYQDMRVFLPLRVWQGVRGAVLLGFFALIVALGLGVAEAGLWWSFLLPVAPLIFFLAPGVWRNACPLATLNQLPRLFGFGRDHPVPTWAADVAYFIAMIGFYLAVFSRKLFLDHSAPASALFLAAAGVLAFAGGLFFRGKSGWCGTFCPMAPVEKLYGQCPYLLIPDSHCSPCVGCNTNCFDFNPRVAYFADVTKLKEPLSRYRRFFAAAFPGFILGYFQLEIDTLGPANTALAWASYSMVSVGLFAVLEMAFRCSIFTLTATFAMAALNIFYWFCLPLWLEALAGYGLSVSSASIAAVVWGSRGLLAAVSVHWIWSTRRNAQEYESPEQPQNEHDLSDEALEFLAGRTRTEVEVCFLQDAKTHLSPPNRSISAIATGQGAPLKVGCMAGICGVDPITIIEGRDNIAAASETERETLQRLGVSSRCRMACMATVEGSVTVDLTPEYAPTVADITDFDPSIASVVIVGAGVGGMTAADCIRKNHPECSIHVISKESHDFYNRISIAKIIENQSPIESLYVKDAGWWDKMRLTRWSGVAVDSIALENKEVTLSNGEALGYDRLILAMGSRPRLPPAFQAKRRGMFGFRGADDAVAVAEYIETNDAREITVVGDGVSGVELAHTFCRMGLRVHLIGSNSRVMERSLDEQATRLLAGYLEGYGVKLVPSVTIRDVEHGDRYMAVSLDNGETLLSELIVFCIGNQPNVEIARDAGLAVERGIVIDDTMRTSAKDVYAVGDVAEVGGTLGGLWTTSSEQGRIAALNALGGDECYTVREGTVGVKVPGIDVMSTGDFRTDRGVTFSMFDGDMKRYARLVINEGKIIGAVTVNYRQESPFVAKAVARQMDVSAHMEPLLRNDLTGFAAALMR